MAEGAKDLAIKLIRAVSDFEKAEKGMQEVSFSSLNLSGKKQRAAHNLYGQHLRARAESREKMYRLARQLWKALN